LNKILIVGAGIAGLTLARALKDSSFTLDIVEKAAAFGPNGCGIVLHPNGVSALGRIGLTDQILAAGNPVHRLRTVRYESALTLPLDDIWAGAEHPTLAMPRSALHAGLRVAASETGAMNAIVRFGCHLTGIEASRRDSLVRFNDGSSGRYGLIVGADGVHSQLRRLLDQNNSAEYSGVTYYRYISRNVIDLPLDMWHTELQRWGAFGFVAVGFDRLHCFALLTGDGARHSAEEGEACFQARLSGFDDRLRETFDARCGPLQVNPSVTARSVFWGTDRCVLIGDAAHAVSPTLTQGGSLAIEDAVALADALRSHADIPSAVDAFRSKRQEPASWAYRMSKSQIKSRTRHDPRLPMNAEVAVDYLRRMYAPLLRGCSKHLERNGAVASPESPSYSNL
jgi:2-polyprenyl-6-methoxyphenol hydroxylase-like FAD-dependent oxidoreductase